METIAISTFKATCLAVLERVWQTRKPVLVAKRGVPIAEVKAPPEAATSAWLGSMAGRAKITGDIVAPAVPDDVWEASAYSSSTHTSGFGALLRRIGCRMTVARR